jgi:hypothetical protein
VLEGAAPSGEVQLAEAPADGAAGELQDPQIRGGNPSLQMRALRRAVTAPAPASSEGKPAA